MKEGRPKITRYTPATPSPPASLVCRLCTTRRGYCSVSLGGGWGPRTKKTGGKGAPAGPRLWHSAEAAFFLPTAASVERKGEQTGAETRRLCMTGNRRGGRAVRLTFFVSAGRGGGRASRVRGFLFLVRNALLAAVLRSVLSPSVAIPWRRLRVCEPAEAMISPCLLLAYLCSSLCRAPGAALSGGVAGFWKGLRLTSLVFPGSRPSRMGGQGFPDVCCASLGHRGMVP